MNFTDVVSLVDAQFDRSLGKAGFHRSGPGTWNRRNGQNVNVVWIQQHSSEPLFCVNLGVHYAFLPKAGTEAPLGGGDIDLPDCEIKLRLASEETARDQWWPFTRDAATQIDSLMSTRGLAVFDKYRLPGAIEMIEAKEVEAGHAGVLSSMTKVRACLLLARMHEHVGNREKCVDAATIGIRLAGMAVGPKKALKDVLKRCSQPT